MRVKKNRSKVDHGSENETSLWVVAVLLRRRLALEWKYSFLAK